MGIYRCWRKKRPLNGTDDHSWNITPLPVSHSKTAGGKAPGVLHQNPTADHSRCTAASNSCPAPILYAMDGCTRISMTQGTINPLPVLPKAWQGAQPHPNVLAAVKRFNTTGQISASPPPHLTTTATSSLGYWLFGLPYCLCIPISISSFPPSCNSSA